MVQLTERIHAFKQLIRKLCIRNVRNVSNLLDSTMFAGDPDLIFNR